MLNVTKLCVRAAQTKNRPTLPASLLGCHCMFACGARSCELGLYSRLTSEQSGDTCAVLLGLCMYSRFF
jgi:hypothetical protein